MTQKLRIGLLMDSHELPLWEYILIERLINSVYASIELVILNSNKKIKRNILQKIKDNRKQIFLFFIVNSIKNYLQCNQMLSSQKTQQIYFMKYQKLR